MNPEQPISNLPEDVNWYAMKVFHNRMNFVQTYMENEGFSFWIPKQKKTYNRPQGRITVDVPILSLVFVHCTENTIRELRWTLRDRVIIYNKVGIKEWKPMAIPDCQVRQFERVVSFAAGTISIFENPDESFVKGDRIRVTGGDFQGLEGYIKRIGAHKRLVIVIDGILAVATAYVPRCFVEKIEDGES